jgi:hypothetical protein
LKCGKFFSELLRMGKIGILEEGGEKRWGREGREAFLKYGYKAQADSIVQTRAGLLLVS